MYILGHKTASLIEKTTFSQLGKYESDIEEILRKNMDMVCDSDEESMLLVGQQVKNAELGRSDLIAIDKFGNLVLIEIKRDKKDIEGRKEAFEFQAIRYAASCATIDSVDKLIQNVYSPYIEKHKTEFTDEDISSSEIAEEELNKFFIKNNISSFNEKQRIILVASEFDKQTLSAVAWLNKSKVDISCYQICPYKIENNILLDMKKVLPTVSHEDFYVDIISTNSITKNISGNITRRTLPKIDTLLKWHIVEPGDVLVAKDTSEEAVLNEDGQVKVGNKIMSLQQWLKGVYGWSSVQTYAFAIVKKNGKTLSYLRDEYMRNHVQEDSE